MGNKKRKAKKRLPGSNQLQEEEMCALEAIYGEYYKPHVDFQGFNLKIVPHPGQAIPNLVSFVLHVRYPDGYPSKRLYMQIHDVEGPSQSKLEQELLPKLNESARLHGANQEVCVYQLVDKCQEYLQQLNEEAITTANQEDTCTSQEQSLWHQMQQRDHDLGDEENNQPNKEDNSWIRVADLEGMDLSSMGMGEDLFEDDDDDDSSDVLRTLPIGKYAESKAASGRSKSRSFLPTPTQMGTGEATPQISQLATDTAQTGSATPSTAANAANNRAFVQGKSPESATYTNTSPLPAEEPLSQTLPRAMRRLFFGDSGTSQSGADSSSDPESDTASIPEQPSEEERECSSHEGDSPSRPGPSSTRVPATHAALHSPAGSHHRARRHGRAMSRFRDVGTEIRAGMLLGHLLVRAAAMEGPDSSVSGCSLALLVSHLDSFGLLPHWLGWLLGSHLDLCEPAFKRMFGQAMDSGELAAAADPAAAKLLKHFWERKPSAPSTPSAQQQQQQQEQTISRYRSDFQELFKLGQGGFGLVVAASNCLDGRQYAIKKIRLHTQLPRSYARIMREVATLSRLQHPNVVRYFQAWCEPLEEGADEREATDDGGEWGSSPDGTEESGSPSRPGKRHSSSLWSRPSVLDTASLTPVQESSDEELFAWDEASHATTATHMVQTEESTRMRSCSSFGQAVASQMLYIQMEFCPRTLSKMIEERSVSKEQAWGVVRGILTGLAYIHSQGVIHRDLKPANIFYDARGEVKLGDFGLAKFSTVGAVPDPTSSSGGPTPTATATATAFSSAAPSDRTGIIGTGYYISPEIANGWASYNEKVDLYSLGVVVFELFHPFSTAMERAVLLRELREGAKLPEEWEAAHQQQAQLIRWLMRPNPGERPSAQEVLRSDFLPVRVEDEQVNDLLRSLPDHRAAYLRVVDQLFAMNSVSAPAAVPSSIVRPARQQPTPAPEIALKWDVPGTPTSSSGRAKAAVLRTLRKVFLGMGAVEMSSSEIGCVPLNPPEDAARMLMADGEMVALRYEVRVSFANWLAAQHALPRSAAAGGGPAFEVAFEGMQRYEICSVHRMKRGRGLPSSYLQADLDVITPALATTPAEKMVADAEVIKATCQILESLPAFGKYEVRLSHRHVYEACVSSLGLGKDVARLVLSQLRAATAVTPSRPADRESSWPHVRNSLDDLGVPVAAALRCRQLVLNLPGVAGEVLPKMRSYLEGLTLSKANLAVVMSALDELEALIGHLQTLGLSRHTLLVDPLLKPHAEYYKGSIFQVHLSLPASGSSSLIATGGRYDALLHRLWAPAALPAPGAVGITLNVERMCTLLAKQQSSTALANNMCPPCQVDVLVCSRGGAGGLLTQRLALVGELRVAGVKAELLRRSCPSLKDQYEMANSRGAKWLVILEPNRLEAAGLVKVKALDKKGGDEEVPLGDVVKYVLQLESSGHHVRQTHLAPSQHTLIPTDNDLSEICVGSLEKRHDNWAARRKGHGK